MSALLHEIILFDENFSITFDFLNLKPKSVIISQTAHFPLLKLIVFLSTANNDFKVGRLPSVV
jgi:hypothetical protein